MGTYVRWPSLDIHTSTNTPTCAQETDLGGDQRQAHALQVAALLTEDKVLLLGFGNDELELDLLPQHGRAEGESMESALRQLQHTHTHALLTQIDHH